VGQTLWEIPAGTRELGESPKKTAERELQEETGYVAGKWTKIGELLLSPGILNERMYVYVAEELRQGKQNLEEGEEIETHVLAWDTALEMIDRGDIVDAKTISALLMWDRTGATNHGT